MWDKLGAFLGKKRTPKVAQNDNPYDYQIAPDGSLNGLQGRDKQAAWNELQQTQRGMAAGGGRGFARKGVGRVR